MSYQYFAAEVRGLRGPQAEISADDQAAIATLHTTLRTAFTMGQLAIAASDKSAYAGGSVTGSGITIPDGATGSGSYLIQLMKVPPSLAAALAGATVNIISVTPTSAGLLSHHPLTSLAMRAIMADSSVVNAGTIETTEDIGGAIRRITSYTFTGNERQIGNIVQISGAYTSGVRTMDLGTTTLSVKSWPTREALSLNDRNLGWQLTQTRRQAVTDVTVGINPDTKVIDPAGSGDVTDPGLIYQANLQAEPGAPWQLVHAPARYGLTSMPTYDDVNLIARLGRGQTSYVGSLANSASLAAIAATSTIDAASRSVIDGLTVEITNGRYALHSESNGSVKGKELTVSNCRLIHRGNTGAVAYQTSISGNPSGVWSVTTAVGVGTAEGSKYNLINSVMMGPLGGFLAHNNPAGAPKKGAVITHKGGASAATTPGYPSHNYQPMGEGRISRVTIEGQSLAGSIQLISYAQNWAPASGVGHPADHREYEISGSGSSPEVFWVSDFGLALRITSPTTTGTSSVVMSGSAVTALTAGSRPVTQVGGGAGLAAYAFTSADVSGSIAGKSLGGLLGNCTTVNKVLTLSINGAAAVNYTLTANYTAMTNAAVLSAINALLGSAATADLFSPGNEYYAAMWDEERILANTSGVDIERGSIVAFDGDDRKIRTMTNADPAWRRAGITLERICANQAGRVKEKGKMALAYIARTDSGTPSFGTTMGVGSVAGKISATHTGPALFRVVRAAGGNGDNDAVHFISAA